MYLLRLLLRVRSSVADLRSCSFTEKKGGLLHHHDEIKEEDDTRDATSTFWHSQRQTIRQLVW